jgi:septum formation protein
MKIYLASRSPRRVELLAQMGLVCDVCPTDIDESVWLNESPKDYVKRVAKAKASACVTQNLMVFDRHIANKEQAVVIAADTTVALDNKILGKPQNDADAVVMLQRLSGKVHEVHTAVASMLMNQCGYSEIALVLSSTKVQMHPMTDAQMTHYIASGEHRDKAGSYGIQGLAATWIQEITGSYTGVMGLPVFETAQILRKFGVYI